MNILFIGDIMGRCGRDAVFELLPEIKNEYSYPLVFMSKKEMRQCAFRVIVYKNRIVFVDGVLKILCRRFGFLRYFAWSMRVVATIAITLATAQGK